MHACAAVRSDSALTLQSVCRSVMACTSNYVIRNCQLRRLSLRTMSTYVRTVVQPAVQCHAGLEGKFTRSTVTSRRRRTYKHAKNISTLPSSFLQLFRRRRVAMADDPRMCTNCQTYFKRAAFNRHVANCIGSTKRRRVEATVETDVTSWTCAARTECIPLRRAESTLGRPRVR